MASSLFRLSQIITDAVSTLNTACQENQLQVPNLDEPCLTPNFEAFRANPVCAEAARVIASAALHLAAVVLPPPSSIQRVSTGPLKAAALRVCLEANVTEILREAGPEGLHVDEIAAKSKIDSRKLARMIRALATNHIYREVSPDVFANNRISSVLDTRKSVDDLFSNPASKYDSTDGFPALVGVFLDEVHKSSAYAWETISDTHTSHSYEVTATAFNLAFQDESPMWTWLERPDQIHRFRRSGIAMQGVGSMQPAEAILKAFDWNTLPADALVVDVGGGVGSSSLPLAKAHPHLAVVIQDRAAVVEEGREVWETKFPEALQAGRVRFDVHDFFTPQPLANASVFLLKYVLHDWPDPYAVKILARLRAAATPDTKLLVIDALIPFACRVSADDRAVPGSAMQEAPHPLLPNYGAANENAYMVDLAMLFNFNSQERTLDHLGKLLESSGWRMLRVNRSESESWNNRFVPVEATPC